MSARADRDVNDSVMIVDDEFLIVMGLTQIVEDMGLEVCASAATAHEAVVLAEKYRPSIVLMDMRLQGERDGVDAAVAIHDRMDAKVIFITGSREPATTARIRSDHPAAVLFKPVSDGQLRATIEKCRV